MAQHLLTKLALAALCAGIGVAQADTATGTFQVKITVKKTCSVTAGAGSDIDIGTHAMGDAAQYDGTDSITVKCSKTVPYNIGLTPSNLDTGGAGLMTLTPDTIAYQLYQDAGYSTAWGNVIGTNTKTGTGNGSNQTHNTYARVLDAAMNVPVGTYVDTVTVTVTY